MYEKDNRVIIRMSNGAELALYDTLTRGRYFYIGFGGIIEIEAFLSSLANVIQCNIEYYINNMGLWRNKFNILYQFYNPVGGTVVIEFKDGQKGFLYIPKILDNSKIENFLTLLLNQKYYDSENNILEVREISCPAYH